jgi:hypothetical protein
MKEIQDCGQAKRPVERGQYVIEKSFATLQQTRRNFLFNVEPLDKQHLLSL